MFEDSYFVKSITPFYTVVPTPNEIEFKEQ